MDATVGAIVGERGSEGWSPTGVQGAWPTAGVQAPQGAQPH